MDSCVRDTTQRVTKGLSGTQCPSFCDLIRRNPPMSLRVDYRRVLGVSLVEGVGVSAISRQLRRAGTNPDVSFDLEGRLRLANNIAMDQMSRGQPHGG